MKKASQLAARRSSADVDEEYQKVFATYQILHQRYAELASESLEAFKRALFIQWYSFSEPDWSTGISELDAEAEEKVIVILNQKLEDGLDDYELQWMFDYYATWDWIFERFNGYPSLENAISLAKNVVETHLPNSIDREEMAKRGQMGDYWNSLTRFE